MNKTVKAMRKVIGILTAAVVLLAMLPTAAVAMPSKQLPMELEKTKSYPTYLVAKQSYRRMSGSGEMQYVRQFREQRRIHQDASVNPKVRFRGIWGFAGDNESDGYVAGVITKGKHAARLRGVWNESNSSEKKGRVVGILKRGYFAGKVITGNGTAYRIAGIYKIDREHRLLKMRWIMPHCSGWTILKIGKINRTEKTDNQ